MADNLSILIKAILSKTTKKEFEQELKRIESSLPKMKFKADYSKNFSEYEKFWLKSIKTIEEKERKFEQDREQRWLKNLKLRDIQEQKTNEKLQQQRIKLEQEYEKFWINALRKRDLQQEKSAKKQIQLNSKVANSLAKQKQSIEIRDFNYGALIPGVDASTFGSRDEFSSYIRQQYGDSAELIGKFNDKMLKSGEVITQANFRVKEGNDKWRMYQATLNKTTGEMRLLDNGLKDVINRQISFNEAMKIAITRIIQWGIATSLVYGSLRQLKDGLNTLKEIDTELINIAKVTESTNEQMKELTKTAVSAGKEFGRTAQEYLKAVTEFARAGMGKQSEEYAKLSLLLQNVGDVTAETANETLIAANAGFQLGGSYEALMGVIDKFNNISNKNATNVNKLSEAMKVGASVFNAAGLSMDETIALIGTATASTQRAGTEISRAWRTILMNIRQVSSEEDEVTEESMKKAESALNSIGVVVRDTPQTFRPMFEILSDLGNRWENLTQVICFAV